ncbi:Ca(2+)-dependent cysteine protease [Entomortierella beljakovae]|nr:Ca(2+)-dependent cysteine protease [Entomortierella beljakovae]
MLSPSSVPSPPEGWAMKQSKHERPESDFQLSNCQGRKKGLFIGINYFGQQAELRGCINDVKNIKEFVMGRYGFSEENCITLTDDQTDPSRVPTRANILSAMAWLVQDAQPNDSFLFHYSGHGGQTDDGGRDEDDGCDETIYPVDHESAGVIVDDEMHKLMVHPLPAGCRLTAVMDCCHSGSALDLPYIYSTSGTVKEASILGDLGKGVFTAGLSYMRGDMNGVFKGLSGMGKKIIAKKTVDRSKKASPADCIMFSGCKDTQTSADAHEQGFGMTGAMTYALITAQEVPHSRSQSPNINGSGTSNKQPQSLPPSQHDQAVISAAPVDVFGIDSNSTFNMESMRSEVFDQDNYKQQSQQRSKQHSPFRWGHSTSSIRSGSNLHHRSQKTAPSYSSDDNGSEIDSNTYGSDEEDQTTRRRNKSRGFGQDRHMEQRSFKDQRSIHREASYTRPKNQSQPQGRVWSENVDLPFILSGYIQVLMNTASVLIFIYIIANFITTIQNDVSLRMEGELRRVTNEIRDCEIEFYKSCNRDVGSILIAACERLKVCMSQPSPSIARATIAAETFAHIANSFVNTISYKTMGFVIVVVLGGLYVSNQAISTYRSNHVMHHQHSIVTPSNQAGPAPLKQGSSFSNGSYPRANNNPTRSWSASSASLPREGSFITSGSNQGHGVQRHRSLLEAPHSEDEFGN